MLASLLIALFLSFLIFVYPPLLSKKHEKQKKSPKYDAQMKKLWSIAQESMKERKPLRAEKALLTILKFDEKNAAAYNRLGILYAKEEKFDEAIECFEIAQSLDSNPSTLHNAGLIYLERGDYEKAAMALSQALDLEGGVASRYIALAKALSHLGQTAEAIDALESAYELEASTPILRQILSLYETSGDQEGIENTKLRINNNLAILEKKRSLVSAQHRARLTRLKHAPSQKSSASKPPVFSKPKTQSKTSPTSSLSNISPASQPQKPQKIKRIKRKP